MKKQKLFALGLLATSLMFSSCQDDEGDDPPPVVGPDLEVSVVDPSATGGGDITIEQGQTLTFYWDARKGAVDMEEFRVSVNGVNATVPLPESAGGNTFPYDLTTEDDELYIDSLTFADAGQNIGVTTYTFTVEDLDGVAASVAYDVTVISSAEFLADPQDFTWMRTGGNPATGLDQFGLAWNTNTSQNAIVVQDQATIMVMLDEDDWLNIETVEGLQEEIAAATPIQSYEGISVVEDAIYNEYLGVLFNDQTFILQIQSSTVTSGTAGTIVTVNGEYKN